MYIIELLTENFKFLSINKKIRHCNNVEMFKFQIVHKKIHVFFLKFLHI